MNPESESVNFWRFRFMNLRKLEIQIHETGRAGDSDKSVGFMIPRRETALDSLDSLEPNNHFYSSHYASRRIQIRSKIQTVNLPYIFMNPHPPTHRHTRAPGRRQICAVPRRRAPRTRRSSSCRPRGTSPRTRPARARSTGGCCASRIHHRRHHRRKCPQLPSTPHSCAHAPHAHTRLPPLER